MGIINESVPALSTDILSIRPGTCGRERKSIGNIRSSIPNDDSYRDGYDGILDVMSTDEWYIKPLCLRS